MSSKELILGTCEKGDLPQLQCVLEETELDVGSESLGGEGETALHVACAHGHLDIVQYLVNDRGCSVAVPNSRAVGATPLEVAWANKHWEVVEFLLKAIQGKELFAEVGLAPTTVTQLQQVAKYGDMALHQACNSGYLEAVRFLMCSDYRYQMNEKGLNLKNKKRHSPTAVSSHGTTPLQVAWENKHWKVVSYLLQAMKEHHGQVLGLSPTAITELLEVAECGEDAFHVACSRGVLEVVRYLHESLKCSMTQLNAQGETPLDIARSNGNLYVIHFLFVSGKCSAPDMTELHIACMERDEEKVRNLASDITSLSIPDQYGITAVHYATFQPENLGILVSIAEQRNMLSLLVLVDGRGNTPLHYAASCGCIKSVQILVSYYKSVNIQNSDGDTPLHLSIKSSYGNFGPVREILQHESCNASIVNAQNETALHIASQYGKLDSAELLLLTGKCSPEDIKEAIEVNLLLHQAVANNGLELVKTLLQVPGCNINEFNSDGETPLHVACRSGFGVFKLLTTDSRCDLNAQNKYGFTALHITIAGGQLEKYHLLITNVDCNPNIVCSDGNAPIHMMIEKDFGRNLSILLKHSKCNPNMRNNEGNSPLHLAVRKCSVACATCLLQHDRVDPNIQNKIGNTPLHEAAITGTPIEIMESLIQHKNCNPQIRNNNEKTPLQIASENGLLQYVSIFILCEKYSKEELREAASRCRYILHYAVSLNNINLVESLQSILQCDINEANQDGETPLHIACRQCSIEIVQMLVADKRCDLNVQNNAGETALHIAVYSELHSAQKVQSILHSDRCNPNVTKRERHTPLHVAVRNMKFQIAANLLQHPESNPNIQDLKGNTPLHMALTSNISLPNVQPFLNHKDIDLSIQNSGGNTPLHEAVTRKDNKGNTPLQEPVMGETPVDVVEALTLHKNCSPSKPNHEGKTLTNADDETALPIACKEKHSNDILEELVEDSRCDLNIQDRWGNTALHRALLQLSPVSKRAERVQCIARSERCDPNITNGNGDTPLHIAVKRKKFQSVAVILNNSKCNPNIQDRSGNTPLHRAILSKTTLSKVEPFLNHKSIDLNIQNKVGNTPLHILCSHGETCDMKILHTLLSTPGINPECVNHAGQIPAELAESNYCVVEMISKYLEHKKIQLETYLKVFVLGNAGGGKSTLIKAITTERSRSFTNTFKSKLVNPSEVPPHTAGIVPLSFNSKYFGHAVLYDFAGQHEYYSSHAAVMENLVLPSPPLFLLLIDISKPMEEIREELVYWWMFINNHSKRVTAPPHVILVGSHEDIVRERGGNVQGIIKQIADCVRNIPVSFQFDPSMVFPLDCRMLVSQGLTALLTQLKLTCKTLRQTADIDLHCHILKAFLTTKCNSSIGCDVSGIVERIKSEEDLLPQEPSQLIPLLSTLSDKGYILLLENHAEVNKSWVVLKPEVLLTEVNGSIFAPENFKGQYNGFAMSTGVVPLSKIRERFGEPNNQVITGYLTHLEFCFQIKDQHTLEMITKDATLQLKTHGSEHVEEYYFFPALIHKENPSDVCQPQETIKYECGWFYRCNEPTEQLTTRFLHVLILRLAFSCDPPDEPTERESVVLLRSCSVWKHGIAWWTNDGIETIVEVGLQCRWVAVMLRCPDTHKVQCAELRTKVISTVLKTKQDFCPAIGMKEFLIAPSSLQYPFEGRELTLYSMREIAKIAIAGKEFPKNTEEKSTIHISKLLPFEPFFNFGEDLIGNFFFPDQSMEELLWKNLHQIAKKCNKKLCEFEQALQPDPSAFQEECVKPNCTDVDRFAHLLLIVQRRGCKTWRNFEQEFSRFSIFCGRNPMVS